MTQTFLTALLAIIVPALIGYMTKWIVDGLKVVRTFADSDPLIKQVAGLVVSTALSFAVGASGLHLAGSGIDTITESDIGTVLNALVGWALAMLFHNGAKLPASPATSGR